MKKVLFSAIFFALISSGPVNAVGGKEQSISQNYPWLQHEFNSHSTEKILSNRKKYDRLDIEKIVLPNNSSINRSYECLSSANIQVLASESADIPMEVVHNQGMSLSSNITHSESNVLVSMQLPEALEKPGKLEITINKKDPSLSFARYGNKTMDFSDASLPPKLKQSFFKYLKQYSNRTAVEIGSKPVGNLGIGPDFSVGLLGELLSENEFKVKSTDLLEDSSETISIGEYQTPNSGKLLAYIDRSMGAIEVKGSNHSVQLIQFENSVNHLPTGVPLHQIALDYRMYRTPEGMFATKTFMETECSLDAPEQLSDTISNQLKGVSK